MSSLKFFMLLEIRWLKKFPTAYLPIGTGLGPSIRSRSGTKRGRALKHTKLKERNKKNLASCHKTTKKDTQIRQGKEGLCNQKMRCRNDQTPRRKVDCGDRVGLTRPDQNEGTKSRRGTAKKIRGKEHSRHASTGKIEAEFPRRGTTRGRTFRALKDRAGKGGRASPRPHTQCRGRGEG